MGVFPFSFVGEKLEWQLWKQIELKSASRLG